MQHVQTQTHIYANMMGKSAMVVAIEGDPVQLGASECVGGR
jgi:hypothetical protein